jgi:hypothetical protein
MFSSVTSDVGTKNRITAMRFSMHMTSCEQHTLDSVQTALAGVTGIKSVQQVDGGIETETGCVVKWDVKIDRKVCSVQEHQEHCSHTEWLV